MESTENKLISIIVPVYKVESYLEFCVQSLLNQTYQNYEIILIDDGSPDRCGEICDLLGEKYTKVNVIHTKNGGLSAARNHGISAARGEYFVFVDSDDFVAPNYIEVLYNGLRDCNADVSVCSFYRVKESTLQNPQNRHIQWECKTGRMMINKLFSMESESMETLKTVVAWNKLYKKELFEEFRFPEGKIMEDRWLLPKLYFYCEKVAVCNEPLYYYRINDESILGSKYNIKRLDELDADRNNLEFFSRRNEKIIYELIEERYFWDLGVAIENLYRYVENSKAERRLLNEERKKIAYKILGKYRLSSRVKQYASIYFTSFVLLLKYRKNNK